MEKQYKVAGFGAVVLYGCVGSIALLGIYTGVSLAWVLALPIMLVAAPLLYMVVTMRFAIGPDGFRRKTFLWGKKTLWSEISKFAWGTAGALPDLVCHLQNGKHLIFKPALYENSTEILKTLSEKTGKEIPQR